jgi:hypothetical protein
LSCQFLNSKNFFINDDLLPKQTTFSDNTQLLIDIINKYNVKNLPTSSSGLSTGDLFTQTATQLGGSGTTKVLCVF